MAHPEYPQFDIQFSNFTFQNREISSDALLECEIEEIPPHSRSVSAVDLHHLARNLGCTSLDQQTYSTSDYNTQQLTDTISEPLGQSNAQRPLSRPLPSSDSHGLRYSSLKGQRKKPT